MLWITLSQDYAALLSLALYNIKLPDHADLSKSTITLVIHSESFERFWVILNDSGKEPWKTWL